MASKTIANLAVAITARTKGLRKGLKNAQRMVADFAKEVAAVAANVAKLGLSFAALAAGGIAVGVGKMFGSLSDLAKTSRKLGILPDNLIALRDAAEESGVSTATLDMGLQRMIRRVSEAAKGTGEAKDALKEMGINARSLAMMKPEQQFLAIGNAMKRFAQPDKIRLAMKIFDTEGVALVNTVEALSEAGGTKGIAAGFKKFRDAIESSGRETSPDSLLNIESILDRFKRFGDVVRGVFSQLAQQIAPDLNRMLANVENFLTRADTMDALRSMVRELANWINTATRNASRFLEQRSTWKEWGDRLAEIRKEMGAFVDGIKDLGQRFGEIWNGMVRTVARVVNHITTMIEATIDLVKRLARIGEIVTTGVFKRDAENIDRIKNAFTDKGMIEGIRAYADVVGSNISGAIDLVSGRNRVANAATTVAGRAVADFENRTLFAREDLQRLIDATQEGIESGFRSMRDGSQRLMVEVAR